MMMMMMMMRMRMRMRSRYGRSEQLPISKQLKLKGSSLEQLQSLSNWTE